MAAVALAQESLLLKVDAAGRRGAAVAAAWGGPALVIFPCRGLPASHCEKFSFLFSTGTLSAVAGESFGVCERGGERRADLEVLTRPAEI